MQKPRYKKNEGRFLIKTAVRSTAQLFDARDPSPFRERDLDDGFVDYLIASAEELPVSAPVALAVTIKEPTDTSPHPLSSDEIIEAIREHFRLEAELARMKRVKIFKRGQLFLLMGMAILVLALSFSVWIQNQNFGFIGTFVKEGILIVGWVALWRPLDVILFEWWPLGERIRLFNKFTKSPIEVRFGSS